jgi:hypothetical protein
VPRIVFPVIVVVAAMLAQSPALGHFFRSDDYFHLYQIEDLGFWRFLVTPQGGHVLPTAYAAFYLCRVLFELNANLYYALAIATHGFNAYLLYRLVETMTGRFGLALAAGFVWGTSSLNQGSIGWYSVYGHVLAGTWTLLFLYGAARVSSGRSALTRATPRLWLCCMLGAATSFGSGIPVAMLSGPVLYFLLPDIPGRTRVVRTQCALLLVVPALFLAVHGAHYVLFGTPTSEEVVARTFVGQIAGEMPSKLVEIFSMFGLLLAYGSASLIFGPVLQFSRAFLVETPWVAYCTGTAMMLALGYSVWRLDRSVRPRALAYLFLAASCYGIIALGRASIYNTMGYPMIEAAMVARYHYLAQAILAVLLAMIAAEFYRPVAKPWMWVAGVAALLLLGANWNASRNINRALPASSEKVFASTVASLEAEIRARARGSRVVIDNEPFADPWARELIPGRAGVFLIHFPANEVDGRHIYFREQDSRQLEFWRRVGGGRLRELLIDPGPERGRRDRSRHGGRRTKRLD